MLITNEDNVHLKLGGEDDWFSITCYWLLIAHLLLFWSFSFFFYSLVLIMITHACWVYMDDFELIRVVLFLILLIWPILRPWSLLV